MRTDKDYAIEHGGYLADTVELYIAARNAHDRLLENEETDPDRLQASAESLTDHWNALSRDVFEFRKRADRAQSVGKAVMLRVGRWPWRTAPGKWVWWPMPGRLGIIYGDHFIHDIFSVRYGHDRIYHFGPLCIKWRPSSGD
jgi:hypothetical protein